MLGTQFYANNSIRFDRQRIVGQGEHHFFTWWEKPLLWPNPQKLFASDEPWEDWPKIFSTKKSVTNWVLILENIARLPWPHKIKLSLSDITLNHRLLIKSINDYVNAINNNQTNWGFNFFSSPSSCFLTFLHLFGSCVQTSSRKIVEL